MHITVLWGDIFAIWLKVTNVSEAIAAYLFRVKTGLLFYVENIGKTFEQNIVNDVSNCTVSHHTK